MKLIKRLLGLTVLLAIAFILIAFILPRTVTVERDIAINAAPEVIFPYVNNPKKTETWSPWLSHDPNTKLTYTGPEAGVGSKMEWDSDNPNVGKGTAEIVESIENKEVKTALDFGPQGTADAWFRLSPEGTSTKVTWGFTADAGMNPIARWMGLMLDKWVGADYAKGLSNLKTLVEAQ